jgi:hypothetical protein
MTPLIWPLLLSDAPLPFIKNLLCGTSHTQTYCDNLKNLAFAIEPPANPIRPTLRDGH